MAAKGYVISYIFIVIFPVVSFDFLNTPFWYASYEDKKTELYCKDYRYDEIFYSHSEKINRALAEFHDGRDGIIDLFYLGFASYAYRDVFKKEVEFVDYLFNNNYYDHNQGMVLINYKDTIDERPLAIKRNIQLALDWIAEIMRE